MNNDKRIQLSANELVALNDEQLETTVGGASVTYAGLHPILIRGIPWEPIVVNPGNVNPGTVILEGFRQ